MWHQFSAVSIVNKSPQEKVCERGTTCSMFPGRERSQHVLGGFKAVPTDQSADMELKSCVLGVPTYLSKLFMDQVLSRYTGHRTMFCNV